jgi:uncharacterized membrane protein
MTHPLTPAQEEALVAAIKQAELRTSGEIRLHLEEKCPTPEPLDRAAQVFAELKMHQTKLRNGVLFYLAWQTRQFAVVGDARTRRVLGGSEGDGGGPFSAGAVRAGLGAWHSAGGRAATAVLPL